jgi:hypothetical protein
MGNIDLQLLRKQVADEPKKVPSNVYVLKLYSIVFLENCFLPYLSFPGILLIISMPK